jgi:hypothetical protein
MATAPAIAPRTDVAADASLDGGFFAARDVEERVAAARRAVFRFAAVRRAGARFALDRLVTVRRVDFFALLRARLRFADDRFAMMTGDG